MEAYVFLAMLVAAFCHAAWNAAIKMKIEPAAAVTMIAVAAAIPALPVIIWTGFPALASWPYLAASTAIHLGYHLALAQAYRSGDLGQVYPIARGTAPLLTAVLSAAAFAEPVSSIGWLGIVTLTTGVLLLSFRGGRGLDTIDLRGAGFALLTACIIAAYTLIDGRGARASGNVISYVAWFFVLDGLMMALWGFRYQRQEISAAWSGGWQLALAGGALSLVSYAIALWAMTVAPIALVAAVRETSVLFAALIGYFVLKEPLSASRILAALMVMGGLVLLRLA